MTDHFHYPSLDKGLSHSRYLARLFAKHPALAAQTMAFLSTPYTRQAMENGLAAGEKTEASLKLRMRQLRQQVMARLICRDLAGLADLTEVMHTTSDLAEVCILATLSYLDTPHERYGQPIGEESGAVQHLLVVGMGKLGGRELNVSSDIDLIFIYPEEGETNGRKKISNHEYFTLLGKKLIQFIDESTEDGFVFRVDMRLRPFGESGPLVSSFAALENYLITQGREWERYAWIKGRVINLTDPGLISLIRPFVYRKYLDYGTYASMRDLHQQIQAEVSRQDRTDNIKLGPGGIREIEFIGQVFQLIRGGRTPLLQQRPTQAILAHLESMGILPSSTVQSLQRAYIFLRNLEHRLQYLDDAQTQDLPKQVDDQLRIAHSMGFDTYPHFLKALQHHRQMVAQHFEQVFILPEEDTPSPYPNTTLWFHLEDEEKTHATLASLGYQHPQTLYQLLRALAQSPRYLYLSERNKKRMDTLLPALLTVSASLPNPDATIQRILRLLENISRRESYLALLAEHPQSLQRLANLYSASPWVSDYLTQHPILLDELLDIRILYQPMDWPLLATMLSQQLSLHHGDTEAQIDALRHFQHTQIFRLVAQDLAGRLTLETLSDHLSDLADLCLRSTLEAVWQGMKQRHQDTPHFAIIAYGKLGGKELGYTSDLDLVFLYDDNTLGADEIYIRFAKRIINWLTVSTAAGQMYEIDLRLRPNGSSGLLVSSMKAFEQYQTHSAWVWEHQALTRARFVAGDVNIKAAFDNARERILCLCRDNDALKAEILAMRKRIQETHPSHADDVKYCHGGLVDIEFIVQYLILAHAHDFPDLTHNTGNIALLAAAAQHQLIDAGLAASAQVVYRQLRRLQHKSGLHGNATPASETLTALAKELLAVQKLWKTVFGEPLL
jgi:glutamate-ammonia-ligase adenylyltransferase